MASAVPGCWEHTIVVEHMDDAPRQRQASPASRCSIGSRISSSVGDASGPGSGGAEGHGKEEAAASV
ncbi:hypothetical protein JCM24511_10079 [Saitozyma sp. JCM 24511]|nr:hypothetical protein JCM24511_10079 [Saitozyma sp. JCM 24511]